MMARIMMLLLAVPMLQGCLGTAQSAREPATCLKPTQVTQIIEWGTVSEEAYTLDARGELSQLQINPDTTITNLGWINHKVYCETALSVTDAFLKVQALHSPGERARYIRYSNPTTGVYLQAVWNPDLQTFQSRDMRRLFDSLMQLVTSTTDELRP